ncbi:WSC domain-containing protein [Lachnellula suecica]|uniref:WSC domain-containing protein n=1 Tax=Lachnellula suecica TaxID=602035 RepID=A0A8T9CIC2_9HELO|nr:WSC domain-containing protein [Lachnellula suecica]
MLSLKTFTFASAALTLFSGTNAGLVRRNEEPAQPSCTDYTPFVYAGCFSDPSAPRALLYDSPLDSQNMTVEKCVAFCKGNDYRYAGLEYYGECFCGASVNGPQIDESNCNFPCTGNNSEICGGNDIISIYQDPTFPSVNQADISDYQPLGCYSEGTSGRSLAWRQDQVSSTSLTIESCLSACKTGGYSIAGVEFGQECYCGVVLGNGTLPQTSGCDVPCTGNSAEICGGSGTLNLFVANDLESSQPCGEMPPSPPATTSSTAPPTTSSSSSSFKSSSSSSSSGFTTSSSSSSSYFSTSSSSKSSSSSGITTSSSSKSCSTSSSTLSSSSTKSTLPPTTSSTKSCSTSTKTTSPPASSTTSCTTSTKPPTTSSISTPPTTKPATTSSTKTTASLCTSTTVITPPAPTCEYKCGNWCSKPMPSWNDQGSCLTAQSNCALQVASCFLYAGFPESMNCFQFSSWCTSVSSYCKSSCPGQNCFKEACISKNPPPSAPSAPVATTSTSVYTCPASSTKPATTATVMPTTTSCVPVPTCSNMCAQPHNPSKGYSSSSPVGNIPIPCLTCNNLKSDYNSGNCFKLYNDPDSSKCPSYPRSGSSGPGKGCKDACDNQYTSCMNTYAQGCKSNKFGDSYSTGSQKCKDQWNDCYSVNSNVYAGNKCGSWNSGW